MKNHFLYKVYKKVYFEPNFQTIRDFERKTCIALVAVFVWYEYNDS